MAQWKGLSHILWKIKNVWNHQPDKTYIHAMSNQDQISAPIHPSIARLSTARNTTIVHTHHGLLGALAMNRPWIMWYQSRWSYLNTIDMSWNQFHVVSFWAEQILGLNLKGSLRYWRFFSSYAISTTGKHFNKVLVVPVEMGNQIPSGNLT